MEVQARLYYAGIIENHQASFGQEVGYVVELRVAYITFIIYE